jgi:hypothetical protein
MGKVGFFARAAVLPAALALVMAGISALADGTTRVSAPLTTGAHIDGTITCSNHPGPEVTLSGFFLFEELGVRAIFRNNVKGTHTHTEDFITTAVLIPEGTSITIPKQPVEGGAGGNPFIWVQLLDGSGNTLTDEIFIGRCVQGLTFDFDPSFVFDALALADVSFECSNNPGPFITITGGLTLPGLKARFIFRNSDNPVGGPHEADAVLETTLIATGTTIQFPKQPPLGGAGGNPQIYIQFIDGDGNALTDEQYIGKCVQLSKKKK